MVLGVPPRPGRLRHAGGLELKIGGAESNLAVALSRLGLSAGWAGYLGDDEPGQLVLDRIRAEGVDTSRVRRIKEHPTGLYLREQVGADVRVYYYRQGSAASTMQRDAFDAVYLSGATFVHLTGITPALSEDCRAFVLWAAREARASASTSTTARSCGGRRRRESSSRRSCPTSTCSSPGMRRRGRSGTATTRPWCGNWHTEDRRRWFSRQAAPEAWPWSMAKSWSTPPLRWRRWIPWEPETPSPPDTWPATCGICPPTSACARLTRWAP